MQGRISQIVGNELNSANEQQGLGVAVLVLVLIISPVIIFLVRSATITIQVMSGILVKFDHFLPQVFSLNLARKAYELNMEKRRGDKLLFQVLSAFVPYKHFSLSSTFSLPLSLSTFDLRCSLPLWPKHFSLKRQSLRRRTNQSRY